LATGHADEVSKTTRLLFSGSDHLWPTGTLGAVIDMEPDAFEELVAEALDSVPDELVALIENCVIVVEDYPPPDRPADLLGIYEGIPLTDKITIYRVPTLRICCTLADVVEEVHITVVHEIAHYFGIDDARLHALGYA
jgi:predicted Zn-dependent protease with MMP-like domain